MNHCYDDGALRAYLDGALPRQELDVMRPHLERCTACGERIAALRAASDRAAKLVAAPTPDTQAALARVRAALPRASAARQKPVNRSQPMSMNRTWRRGLSAVAGLAIVIALLALPPVQAAADQLLKIFRVQSVVFVPIGRERMQELQQLDFDESTLFVAEPKLVTDPGEPTTVASAAEASNLAGFVVTEPALPTPPSVTEYRVRGRSVVEAQVDVNGARQLLQLAGVTDVTLPDALGTGPISADVPPAVISTYRGDGYDLTLVQGTSPAVTLPEGVELSQLGTALLRLLGTSPDQAAQLSSQIDWSTTFVFPFPANMSGVRTVSVDGLTGLLVTSRENGEAGSQIYWQRGERFYVLQARGDVGEDVLLGFVSSIR